MTRRLTVVIALLMILAVASSAFAAASTKTASSKAAPSKTVTLELTDTTVVEAVESLFKGTSYSYILEPGVGGTISSLRIKDVSFDKALNALMKAASLQANLEDGIYIIGKTASEPAPKPAVEQPKPAAGTDQVVEAQPVLPDQEYQAGYGPVMDPYYGPMGPVAPDGAPVYYGPMGPQGYYPGYNNYGYNPYGFYGPPQVLVPGVQRTNRVRAGTGYSSGFGRFRVIGPNNMQAPR